MTRDEVIKLIAQLLAGLQVPISMSMPLGAALDPLHQLYGASGFGWRNPKEFETWLKEVLA